MSTLIKTLLTFIIAVIVIYAGYGKFSPLQTNMGSLWINVNIYYIIALGLIVPGLFFIFKKPMRILYSIILVLLLVYLVITVLDGWNNLRQHSLLVYILALIGIGFIVERYGKVRRR